MCQFIAFLVFVAMLLTLQRVWIVPYLVGRCLRRSIPHFPPWVLSPSPFPVILEDARSYQITAAML